MSRDFVEFINSEDVKKYVRESGYQLSSQEAAFVVWQSKNTPLEGTFAALKPISQYIKGNLTEDLFLNSVLALLHQPRRERTLSISLTTAVRKSPTES